MIWVTGTGCCGASAEGLDGLWANLLRSDTDAASAYGQTAVYRASCPGMDGTESRALRRMDRVVHLGWAAVREARRAAGLDGRPGIGEGGLIVGSARGPVSTVSAAFSRSARGLRPFPTQVAAASPASLAACLAELAGIRGATFVISAACASGAAAIATAADLMSAGHGLMIAGGADAPLDTHVIAQFESAGALGHGPDPRRVLRPFDRHRTGTALGEGAGFVVLERDRTHEQEGCLGVQLSGWGMNFAAGERQKPDASGQGLAVAIRRALIRSGLETADVSAIVMHGNGTIAGDAAEIAALTGVFGVRLAEIPCTAIKAVTGHAFGGSSAMEAVAAIEIARRGCVPPVANCDEPEWDDIGLVRGKPLPGNYRHVMVVSSGFWGNHTALIFSTES